MALGVPSLLWASALRMAGWEKTIFNCHKHSLSPPWPEVPLIKRKGELPLSKAGWLWHHRAGSRHDSSSPAEMILFINVPARSDFRAHVKHMCSCVAGRGHLVNDFFLSPLGAWGELIRFTEASHLFLEVHHEPCQVSKALENSPSPPPNSCHCSAS